MKKILVAMSFAAAVALPGAASAAEIFEGTIYAVPTGGAGANVPDTATTYTCDLVASDVKLGVSNNVVGGIACDEANNLVQVAACHAGGSRDTGVSCSSDADLNTDEIELPSGCADNTGNSTEPSFKAFTLSSAGGVMSEAALSGRCTTDTLGGITWVN
ncbi:MAG: hypothetical protein R6X32_23020 [Chloroflexota bacterium]